MAAYVHRYATAFASVARSASLDLAAVKQQLLDFAGTFDGSAELRDILMNPSVPAAQKLKVIDAIAAKIGMLREVRNFIAVIMDHEHLGDLHAILAAYDEVADESAGIVEVEVTSALPLNEDDRQHLEWQISKMVVSRIKVAYAQDATLLGGAVVRVGSTVYDGSVKAQFAQLKQRLVNA